VTLPAGEMHMTSTTRRRLLGVAALGALGGCTTPRLALEWNNQNTQPQKASKIVVVAQNSDTVIARVSEDLMSEAIGRRGVPAVAAWRLLPDRRNMQPDEQTLKLAVGQAAASHLLLLQTQPPQQTQQFAPVTHGGFGYFGAYRRFYGTTGWAPVMVTTVITSASLYDARNDAMLWGGSHRSNLYYGLRPELEEMVNAVLEGLSTRGWLPPRAG
jgi:hypothetical protein